MCEEFNCFKLKRCSEYLLDRQRYSLHTSKKCRGAHSLSFSNINSSHELANLYEHNNDTQNYKVTIDDVKQSEYLKNHWDEYIIGNHGGLFEPQGGLRTTAIELSKFLRILR